MTLISLYSLMQRPHGVFQLASRACPATYTDGPNGLHLHAVTPNDTASLSFSVPGTVRILVIDASRVIPKCSIGSIMTGIKYSFDYGTGAASCMCHSGMHNFSAL